jgi:hypothetical protein
MVSNIERDGSEECTHGVLVLVGGERVADLLGGRLLGLGLEGGAGGVGVALELVAEVLGGQLLRVGLDGSADLVGEGLAADWSDDQRVRRRAGTAGSRSDMV